MVKNGKLATGKTTVVDPYYFGKITITIDKELGIGFLPEYD